MGFFQALIDARKMLRWWIQEISDPPEMSMCLSKYPNNLFEKFPHLLKRTHWYKKYLKMHVHSFDVKNTID